MRDRGCGCTGGVSDGRRGEGDVQSVEDVHLGVEVRVPVVVARPRPPRYVVERVPEEAVRVPVSAREGSSPTVAVRGPGGGGSVGSGVVPVPRTPHPTGIRRDGRLEVLPPKFRAAP